MDSKPKNGNNISQTNKKSMEFLQLFRMEFSIQITVQG